MCIRNKWLPVLALVIFCAFASEVRADPVVITSGSLSFGRDGFVRFNLLGNGFTTQGTAGASQLGSSFCSPCRPGETVRIRQSGSIGPPLFGVATFNGISAPAIGGSLGFDGFNTLPTEFVSTLIIEVPFTFNGVFSGFDSNPAQGPANRLFTTTLTGQGIATLQLSGCLHCFPGGLYQFDSITYNFQPAAVPEPTTLLLLGTGLAGVAARVRQRRKARAGA